MNLPDLSFDYFLHLQKKKKKKRLKFSDKLVVKWLATGEGGKKIRINTKIAPTRFVPSSRKRWIEEDSGGKAPKTKTSSFL